MLQGVVGSPCVFCRGTISSEDNESNLLSELRFCDHCGILVNFSSMASEISYYSSLWDRYRNFLNSTYSLHLTQHLGHSRRVQRSSRFVGLTRSTPNSSRVGNFDPIYKFT